MKISVVIDDIDDRLAFADYTLEVISRLAKHHQLRVYCQTSKRLNIAGIQVRDLPVSNNLPRWLGQKMFLAQVERELETDGHDVVYSHEARALSGVYVMDSSCHKTLSLENGTWFSHFRAKLSPRHLFSMRLEALQFSQQKNDVVIVPSEYLKRNLAFCYPQYDSKVVVISPGVDSNKDLRASYTGQEELRVLFVGTDFNRKGLEQALRGFACSQLKRAQLKVAGGTPSSKIKKLCRELNIEKRVEFMGFVQNMSELYAGVHVLLSPVLDSPFGRSILEAMSAGLPVITSPSSCCGVVEQLNQDECVILRNPHDPQSIAFALENLSEAGVWARFSRKSLAASKRFTWDRCVEKTLEAINHYSESVSEKMS